MAGKIFNIMLTGENVGKLFWGSIETMRVELGVRKEEREGVLDKIGVKAPVLKYKEDHFRSWIRFLPPRAKKLKTFDVVLHGENGKYIILRFTTHDLYLRAIGIVNEVKGHDGRDERLGGEREKQDQRNKAKRDPIIKWFEFRLQSGEERIVEKSEFLPITCSYLEHADAKLRNINGNPDKFVAFINELNSGSPHLVQRICEYMPHFSFFISESLRFYKVAKFFASQLERTRKSEGMGAKRLDMIRRWAKFSHTLLWGELGKYTLEELKRARKELLLGVYVEAAKKGNKNHILGHIELSS